MTALVGAGSHGKDIASIFVHAYPGVTLDIYDDAGTPPPALLSNILIGVNDPSTRRKIAERYPMAAPPLIDPQAIVGLRVHVEHGCVIAPGAVLLCDVWLGKHTHINYQASMTRCRVGAFTTVSPAATICGDVTIGEECLIGAGATVCDRVKIGNRVRIGAGAIVLPLSVVPDDSTVVGVWKDKGVQ